MQRTRRIISLMAVLLCGTACLKWPNPEVSSKPPDRVLFNRAMSALEQDRFAVANLTLQTLVNTYPDSEYASKAELLLEVPRIAECGNSWNSFPQCDGRRGTTPPTP
jgi:outer membrane protein assembly factor BamD